jgi:ketosteroid isomerase-like protein
MTIPLRFTLASAIIAGAALFSAPAPALHAHEEKPPARAVSAMQSASPTEAWGTINALREKLATQVASKNLKPVHETAEQFTAALITLREASHDLPADKLKRVQGAVANLVKALDGAHEDADKGNQAGTEKQLKAIDGLLKVLAAQYPGEASAAKPAGMAREDHSLHPQEGMTYSCPMHPDVTSGKSGDRCPKCGMALVPTVGASPAANSSDQDAIKAVLGAYNQALTSLDAAKAQDLFTADSAVFESGGVEGTYAHYLEHHIGPELAEFKEFSFRDYKVEVRLEPPVALATETYIYKIVLKEGDRVIEKRGVATSVLKKVAGEWKIIQTHTSSRNVPKKN